MRQPSSHRSRSGKDLRCGGEVRAGKDEAVVQWIRKNHRVEVCTGTPSVEGIELKKGREDDEMKGSEVNEEEVPDSKRVDGHNKSSIYDYVTHHVSTRRPTQSFNPFSTSRRLTTSASKSHFPAASLYR